MIYYSSATKAFIPEAWKTDGTYSECAWPSDAVHLSDEEQNIYWKKSPPEGKQLGSEDGRPAWVDLPSLTLADIASNERSWRDGALLSIKWLRERHRDQQEIGGDTALSGEQFTELLFYVQALRDWPQNNKFPDQKYRPVAPEWISGRVT